MLPCRPTPVTRHSDTGTLWPMPGAEPWRIGTHRSTSGATRECTVANRSITGTDRDHVFAPNRVWSVALPGMYERTRVPSRFVPVRPGPPATNCRGTPGRIQGQCERDYRPVVCLTFISFNCLTTTV